MEISPSQDKCWRRCQRQYYFKYIRNLQKKVKSLPLKRGSLVHECLKVKYLKYKGGNWLNYLKEYKKKEFDQLFDEEKALYGNLPKDVYRLMRGYEYAWKEEDKGIDVIAVEDEIKVGIKESEVIIKGTIDLVIKDGLGVWIVDHKTTKNMPKNDYKLTDIQTSIYYKLFKWVCKEKYGIDPNEVVGIIFNYIRTKPPAEPQLLKKGGLSKSKNTDTDKATFLAAIKRYGLDPKDYKDVLSKLDNKSFYHRARLVRPQGMVDNLTKEVIKSSKQIKEAGSYIRSFDSYCDWGCEYQPLCIADLMDYDSQFIIKKDYEERRTVTHVKEEEE